MNMNFIMSTLKAIMESSNFFPALAALICVIVMAAFLIKAAIVLQVHNPPIDTVDLTALHNLRVPQLKMTRVHIPFTLRLVDTGISSYNEIKLYVSSQIHYSIQAFWAVSIRELHMSLWKTWQELQDLRNRSNRNILDPVHYQCAAFETCNQISHAERIITIKSPMPPLVLGPPPRLAYPLVVFLMRDTNSSEIIHPDETVLLVNVIHLRDPVCPLPTSILAQYLKQANGQLSCLKQLYMAAGDTISEEASINSGKTTSLSMAEPVACVDTGAPLLCSDGPHLDHLCAVCHYFPLSRALLPCRHTCVCALCFMKLNRCPMCRSPITSYFCIRSEEYIPPGSLVDSRINNVGKGTIHWIDALNDRLTDFLGFR